MTGKKDTTRQDATDANSGLSVKQDAAIPLLLAGETVSEVASALDVHRSTVHRWMALPEFVATLNSRRWEAREASEARLHQLQIAALDAIERAVENGDARIALAVLKGTGLLEGKPLPIGPAEVKGVESQVRDRERQRELLGVMLGPDVPATPR